MAMWGWPVLWQLAEAKMTSDGGTNNELTPILAKYLDRHLVFPLLEFLQAGLAGVSKIISYSMLIKN